MSSNPTHMLQMRFDPRTIKQLGVNTYSTLPPILAELIANSYDADAKEVKIILDDVDKNDKRITISDDGHGMSFAEINNHYLTIGANRRERGNGDKSPGGRDVIGRKGLGKLAFFGIAHRIILTTIKDGYKNEFEMNWDKIMGDNSSENSEPRGNYTPDVSINDEPTSDKHGTTIILTNINRPSGFDPEGLADAVARYFILQQNDFTIKIKHNNGGWITIDADRCYSSLKSEFTWKVPEDIGTTYIKDKGIRGQLITTEKPIPPSKELRGITLFSRTKFVNRPEYFSEGTSSHFFSYLTGWLEIDFIEGLGEEVTNINRKELNWDHPDMEALKLELQNVLKQLQKEWRQKRKKATNDRLKDDGIDINRWSSTLPDEVRKQIIKITSVVSNAPALSSNKKTKILKGLKKVAPEYIYYHYRGLHKELSDSVARYYRGGSYHDAVLEGVRVYVEKVRKISGLNDNLEESALLSQAFHNVKKGKKDRSVLLVTAGLQRANKQKDMKIPEKRFKNIEEANKRFALAIWSTRNVFAHTSNPKFEESNLFTEQNCLDALSILSYLFYRLDNAEKRKDK